MTNELESRVERLEARLDKAMGLITDILNMIEQQVKINETQSEMDKNNHDHIYKTNDISNSVFGNLDLDFKKFDSAIDELKASFKR